MENLCPDLHVEWELCGMECLRVKCEWSCKEKVDATR